MAAFREVAAAIDRLSPEAVAPLNPAPLLWSHHAVVFNHIKFGLMADFQISSQEWDEFFDGSSL